VPTFTELGEKWIDRRLSRSRRTPRPRRRIFASRFPTIDALKKDPDLRKRMVECGFEVTDIGYEAMPAFLKEPIEVYMGIAKAMGW